MHLKWDSHLLRPTIQDFVKIFFLQSLLHKVTQFHTTWFYTSSLLLRNNKNTGKHGLNSVTFSITYSWERSDGKGHYSQTGCLLNRNSVMLQCNAPILIDTLIESTSHFQFKFAQAKGKYVSVNIFLIWRLTYPQNFLLTVIYLCWYPWNWIIDFIICLSTKLWKLNDCINHSQYLKPWCVTCD